MTSRSTNCAQVSCRQLAAGHDYELSAVPRFDLPIVRRELFTVFGCVRAVPFRFFPYSCGLSLRTREW
jgi:hypothetical protein